MNILAITAMDVEKESLLQAMDIAEACTLVNKSVLYKGQLDGQPFALVEAGIGKANAAMTCVLAVQACPWPLDLIVNSGVAGGLTTQQRPGDLVIAESVCYYDVDVTPFGYTLGQVPGQPAVYQTSSEAVQLCTDLCHQFKYQAKVGQIISGDCFVHDAHMVTRLKQAFPLALAVEMEGAAVAHAAYRCGVPVLVLRALSDSADGEAKESYQHFLTEASRRSETIVRSLVHAKKNA